MFKLNYPETAGLIRLGRVLCALLTNFYFSFFHKISDFSYARMVSLLLTIVNLFIFSKILVKKYNIGAFAALAIGFSIFILPSAQIFILWNTAFILGTLNIFFVLISFLLIDRGYLSADRKTQIKYMSIGWAMWFLTLYVHQSTSYFICVFSFLSILYSKNIVWNDTRKRVMKDITIVLSLTGIYYILTKMIVNPLIELIFQPLKSYQLSQKYVESFNIIEKFETFKSVYKMALHLWFFPYADYFVYIYIFVILCCLVTWIISNWNSIRINLLANKAIFCLFILLMCELPIFVTSWKVVPYRTVFPAAAIGVILLFFAIEINCRALPKKVFMYISVLLISLATLFSSYHVLSASLNASKELDFLRNSLSKIDLKSKSWIILFTPDSNTDGTIVNAPLIEDFRYMGSLIPGFPYSLYEEMNLRRDKLTFYNHPMSRIPKWVQYSPSSKIATINMLDAGYRKNTSHENTQFYIDLEPLNIFSMPMFAFDKLPDTFWESSEPLPFNLKIYYPEGCKTILKYKYTANIQPYRMPTEWKIYGSANTTNSLGAWHLLDHQVNVDSWQPSEEREYKISNPGCYDNLRIEFLKAGNENIIRVAEIDLE